MATMKRAISAASSSGLGGRCHLAAAVGVQDILDEHLLQSPQVTLLGGREEPLEQRAADSLISVKAGAWPRDASVRVSRSDANSPRSAR